MLATRNARLKSNVKDWSHRNRNRRQTWRGTIGWYKEGRKIERGESIPLSSGEIRRSLLPVLRPRSLRPLLQIQLHWQGFNRSLELTSRNLGEGESGDLVSQRSPEFQSFLAVFSGVSERGDFWCSTGSLAGREEAWKLSWRRWRRKWSGKTLIRSTTTSPISRFLLLPGRFAAWYYLSLRVHFTSLWFHQGFLCDWRVDSTFWQNSGPGVASDNGRRWPWIYHVYRTAGSWGSASSCWPSNWGISAFLLSG